MALKLLAVTSRPILLGENNHPVMGVVYSPASGVTYYAYAGKGAWKIPDMAQSLKIQTHKHELPSSSIAVPSAAVPHQ